VRLIGDLPIYVAHDSADVWAHRDLFELDEEGRPTVVAGVPPDYFSLTGQRWGNPIYRWKRHAGESYAWWVARLRRALEWFDFVRIDHFRGFAGYWEIPATEPTAVLGRWVEGPGLPLFERVRRELGALPFIAEDLGLITADVEELRDRLGIPGMRVAQFAFGADPEENPHWPSRYVANSVAFTGTTDNDTIVGWFADLTSDAERTAEEIEAVERRAALEGLAEDGTELPWRFIRALLESNAGAVIFPLQDVLGLGTESRMNHPGRPEGNWRWRFCWEDLTEEIRARLAEMTLRAGR
jgi:4-alpha-glucanotransferase